jgi:putative ABC transport system permease protein
MDTLMQDVRYAVRALVKQRGFTVIAVLTLALGIGINTTMFSVINATLIRPLPQVEMEGLVTLHELHLAEGTMSSVSLPNLSDWQERSTTLAEVAAFHDSRVILTGAGGEPEVVEAEATTTNLFAMLGVQPMLGRLFLPEEGRAGRGDVVLLSHHYWSERFGADPAAVGRTLSLDGVAHTIVGVMPPRFGFPDNQPIWVPIVSDASGAARGSRYLRVVGRLRPDVTIEAAQAELSAIAAALAAQYPETNAGRGVRVNDFYADFVGPVRTPLLVMLGAVGFVLLIACANVANLLLARGAARQKEIAVRVALGAHRGRLVRQLLTESTALALVGATLGIGFAHLGLTLILGAFPFQPPLWMDFSIDRNVLLFTFSLALGTGLLFGAMPALRATRPELMQTLRDGGRGTTTGAAQGRMRSGLVVAELALASVLLVGALLMVRSLLALQSVDPGFDSARTVTMRIVTGGEAYAAAGTRDATFERLLAEASSLPGVEATALTSALPLGSGGSASAYVVIGQQDAPGERPMAEYRSVSAGYFDALGVTLLHGRAPTEQEVAHGEPVVVINRFMAERHWPGTDAIGQQIRIGSRELAIIGVAPDLRLRSLDERPVPQVYAPFTLRSPYEMALMVRGSGDIASLTPVLRRIVAEIDASLPLSEAATLTAVIERSVWRERLFSSMFASFALIALLLAVIGVYGVMAYVVSQRTHEIGVRMALGAGNAQVLRMVVRQGAGLAALGVGIGLLLGLGLSRLLSTLLYGVTASDPLTFAATATALVMATLLAAYLPARRAARVDPMVALRAE